MASLNYYLHKNNETKEILYLEYNKIDGYPITPKTRIEDAIEVNKIIFVNPSMSEKIIKKKIEIKLRYYFRLLELLDSDPTGSDEGDIQRALLEAERLRINIINHYVKYLGNTYGEFAIRKLQVVINQLRIKLYNSISLKRMFQVSNDLYYLDEEEPKKGRGR